METLSQIQCSHKCLYICLAVDSKCRAESKEITEKKNSTFTTALLFFFLCIWLCAHGYHYALTSTVIGIQFWERQEFVMDGYCHKATPPCRFLLLFMLLLLFWKFGFLRGCCLWLHSNFCSNNSVQSVQLFELVVLLDYYNETRISDMKIDEKYF